jgi:hypothetical protein
LDRDPSSGTALQEISFWLGLERALQRIQEKRDGIEVTLTLEILKHGKRFLATVSFDSDTGNTILQSFCICGCECACTMHYKSFIVIVNEQLFEFANGKGRKNNAKLNFCHESVHCLPNLMVITRSNVTIADHDDGLK